MIKDKISQVNCSFKIYHLDRTIMNKRMNIMIMIIIFNKIQVNNNK